MRDLMTTSGFRFGPWVYGNPRRVVIPPPLQTPSKHIPRWTRLGVSILSHFDYYYLNKFDWGGERG